MDLMKNQCLVSYSIPTDMKPTQWHSSVFQPYFFFLLLTYQSTDRPNIDKLTNRHTDC